MLRRTLRARLAAPTAAVAATVRPSLSHRGLVTHPHHDFSNPGDGGVCTPRAPLSLGIRREDKNRWERRVPLVPDHVERLVKELGVRVLVQPSSKRVIPDEKYEEAGAVIQDDLSGADVILGVKEVPVEHLIPDKTYLFFSHTHKAQPYNMPLLKALLDKRIRLIDYELMKDDSNRRLVLFSRFAGYAGFMDGANGLGHRLLAKGFGGPFLACGLSYMYRCVADARLDMTRTGQVIMDDGLPRQLGPMVFVFTGSGNVTKGAIHMFKCLPHVWVKPEELKALVEDKSYDNRKVYGCMVQMQDYIERKDGGEFSRSEYLARPDLYKSVFHEKIAPYASMIVNGIFWDERYPRLLTKEQTLTLAREKRLRLLQVADISCDFGGSLEFVSHATTIDKPFFMYDPISGKTHDDTEGEGIQIMSIDNLPTEMPLEASEYFGDALFPFVVQLARGNFDHPVLKGAAITASDGTLEQKHEKLYSAIEEFGVVHGSGAKVTSSQKILLLGSGYVSAPLVDYLLRSSSKSVTIASNAQEEARRLSNGRPNAPVTSLDVNDAASMRKLVESHDIVVSFVPASLHPAVAEHCLSARKHLVTASYISPAMKALHERAKSAGVTFMNEIGLDPGIDHLTAVRQFDDIRRKGGKLTSFVSWCGGLPAPEASGNPLGYKFSWSPKGVLLAGLNGAKFKMGGKLIEVPGPELMRSAVPVSIYPGFALEGLPNRDSLSYLDTYQLGSGADLTDMFRGTLRFKGYAELMGAFNELGLLDAAETNIPSGTSWKQLMGKLLGCRTSPEPKHWREAVARKLRPHPADAHGRLDRVMDGLNWLEMLSDGHPVHNPSPSVLDAFCALLQAKLVYLPDERDMVIMHHEFGVNWGGDAKEKHTSTLIAYGDPNGYSAMAKTVGLPAAIATEMVLSGEIHRRGVVAPVHADIYVEMLKKLEGEGIRFHEKVVRL
ncbi:Saccharopine dehydrogenase-domain-containing protein [Zopfochytrium polystomum]|nr:Saccharopine dehydrogenase-domain-containing protein [Zopfochytrium polystomum]